MITASPSSSTPVDHLRSLAEALMARDAWRADRMRAYQRERLRSLIRHAATASPYYGQVFGRRAAKGDVPLTELPTLPKATLVEELDRIVIDPRLRRRDIDAHLAGPDAAGSLLGAYRVVATSGTTGERVVVVFTNEELDVWTASAIRMAARVGVAPTTRLVAIGSPSPLHVTRVMFAAMQAGRGGAPQLSVTTPLAEVVAALNAYQPEAILTYASIAAQLADEQVDGALRIAPRIVISTSEVLGDDVRVRIRRAWGVEPANAYAATEAPPIAGSSPRSAAMHVSDDLVVVEVVDEHNRPVPAGEAGYRVLLTNLVNRAQPLIRYEISDSLTMAPEGTDPAGLPYTRILRVDGRSDDILQMPARGGGACAVNPCRLRQPFVHFPEVRRYQVVHRAHELEVRVELAPLAPADVTTRVRSALEDAIAAAGVGEFPVKVVVVDGITRDNTNGAKLKTVMSMVPRS